MNTSLIRAAALVFLLACGSAPDVNVDSLESAIEKAPAPRPTTTSSRPVRRLALVLADFNEVGARNEANAMVSALNALGYTVRTNLGSPISTLALLDQAVSETITNDTILIDIQTHGGDVSVDFNTPSGTRNMSIGWGAVHHASNPGLFAPTTSAQLGTHWFTFARSATQMEDMRLSTLAQRIVALRSRGARVAVVDHSCNGGATVRWAEINAPSMCALTTAGMMSPSGIGYPAFSGQLPSLATLEDAARYVNNVFAGRYPDRFGQAGFRTACSQSMSLRDTAGAAMIAYDSWWHWMSQDITHVARMPARYTMVDTAHEPVTSGWHADSETGEGWIAYSQLAAQDYWARQGGSSSSTAALNATHALTGIIAQQRASIENLRNALQSSRTQGEGVSLDTYLRDVIVLQCICPSNGWADVSGLSCSDRYMTSKHNWLWRKDLGTLAVPSNICTAPANFANAAMRYFPTVSGEVSNLQNIESRIRSAMLTLSSHLATYESSCVSSPCTAFTL